MVLYSNATALKYLNQSFNITIERRDINSTLATIINPQNIITWTTLTLFICLAGCLISSLVLYITWPRKGDKSGVNVLIFHYIFVNLLFCSIHIPIRCVMVQAKQYGYTGSWNLCFIVQGFNSLSWMVLYWADAGLAVNRCIALFLPHVYKTYSNNRANFIQITLLWVINIAIFIPSSFDPGTALVVLSTGHCAYRFGGTRTAYTRLMDVTRYMPFAIAGLASVLILWKCYVMSRKNLELHPYRAGERSPAGIRIHQRIVLAQMLVLTFAWSMVMNITSFVIIAGFPMVFLREPTANLWLQTGGLLQYALTPCIFLFSNTKYRDRLHGITRRITPLEHSMTHVGKSGRMTLPEAVRMSTLALNSRTRTASCSVHVMIIEPE